jgi:hypothetical protein
VSDNDFEYTITASQDTVIALDTQPDTYLDIPKLDTFGFNSQPLSINNVVSNPFLINFNSTQGMYNILQFTGTSTGSSATVYFLAIGV